MLGSALEKYPQIQIVGDAGGEKSRFLREFKGDRDEVALFSTELQRKIQRALAPYWQMRFVSFRDDDAPRVRDLLLRPEFYLHSEHYVEDTPFPRTDPARLDEALAIAALPETVLSRKLLSLSNGELRRILLARLWMESPKIILFDDLFGGLDPVYRGHIASAVVKLAKTGVPLVIGLERAEELFPEIPAFVCKDGGLVPYEGKLPGRLPDAPAAKAPLRAYEISELRPAPAGETLFSLNHVHVRYGSKEIIKDLTWNVRKGEHWVVMGENGAGKSTLLALLSADHPQMYSNDITLFGKKPGQGLDIWDHKAQIGFFSPELAEQYREKLSLSQVLCTGYSTSLALFHESTWEERKKAVDWLHEFGFMDTDRDVNSLSVTEKRLVLIARAAIKPPRVLILDEPTQGMDIAYRERLFGLLEFLSKETTLIFVTHYDQEWPRCMTHLLRMPKFSLDAAPAGADDEE